MVTPAACPWGAARGHDHAELGAGAARDAAGGSPRPASRLWARRPGLRYPRGVTKIIREILKLLWKVLRLVLWKWLRLRLGRILMMAAAFVGLIVLVVVLLSRL